MMVSTQIPQKVICTEREPDSIYLSVLTQLLMNYVNTLTDNLAVREVQHSIISPGPIAIFSDQ